MKRIILAALVGVLVSGAAAPAIADHCPIDAKRIDAVLENLAEFHAMSASVGSIGPGGKNLDMVLGPVWAEEYYSDDLAARFKKWRDKGIALHKNDQHGKALEVLHYAMGYLRISHKYYVNP